MQQNEATSEQQAQDQTQQSLDLLKEPSPQEAQPQSEADTPEVTEADTPTDVAAAEAVASLDNGASDKKEEAEAAPVEEEASTQEDAESVEDGTEDEVASSKISYNTFEDIDLDAMPAEARRYFEPAFDLIVRRELDLQKEKEDYRSAKLELEQVSSVLQEVDGEDRKPFIEALEAKHTTIVKLSDDIVQTSWDAFQRLHPEAKSLPPEVQDEVASQFNGIGVRFTEGSTLNQMEDAYQYALFKSGHQAGSKPGSVETKRQTVVSDGQQSTAPSRVGVDELNWDELLEKHQHLL